MNEDGLLDSPAYRLDAVYRTGTFYKAPKLCADDSRGCSSQQKAYLVPGDFVLAGEAQQGFRCAYYGTAKGRMIHGLLPDGVLEAGPAMDIGASFLVGAWSGGEGSQIIFSAAGGRSIHAKGSARDYGGQHEGYFVGTAEPRGDSIVFRDVEEMEGCEVKAKRRGPFLVVGDNDRCGGVKVKFEGIYTKNTK